MNRKSLKSQETSLKAILIIIALIVLCLAFMKAGEGTVRKINGHEYIYLPANTYAPLQHSPDCPCGKGTIQ